MLRIRDWGLYENFTKYLDSYRPDIKNNWLHTAVYGLCTICVCVNFGFLLYAYFLKDKILRKLNFLLGNLSICCAIGSWAIVWSSAQSSSSSIDGFFCSGVEILKYFICALYPLTVLAINHEILGKLNKVHKSLPLPVLIPVLWALAAIITIPTAWTQIVNKELGVCQMVPLFGFLSYTIVYEIVRFLILGLGVTGFITMDLRKLGWSKSQGADSLDSATSKKRWSKIRFHAVCSLIFIFTWIPLGLYVAKNKIMGAAEQWTFPTDSDTDYYIILSLVSPIFSICVPIIIICRNVVTRQGKEKERVREWNSIGSSSFEMFKNYKTKKSDSDQEEGKLERKGPSNIQKNVQSPIVSGPLFVTTAADVHQEEETEREIFV